MSFDHGQHRNGNRRGASRIRYGQALAEAWGKHVKTGMPYFFSEKELDHGDKLELLLGMINGRSKIRFEIDHGDTKQFTDYGAMCIDTVVKLAA